MPALSSTLSRPLFIVLPLLAAAAAAQAADSPAPTAPPAAREASPSVLQFDLNVLLHLIHHHQQAVAMARLVPERSRQPEIRLLSELIARNQTAEIELFRHWHQGWSETLRNQQGHAAKVQPQASAASAPLPVMPELPAPQPVDMAALRTSHGADFDRLFLRQMIAHHQGAVELAGVVLQRAGQPQLRERARRMIDEQQNEIVRLRQLLQRLPPSPDQARA